MITFFLWFIMKETKKEEIKENEKIIAEIKTQICTFLNSLDGFFVSEYHIIKNGLAFIGVDEKANQIVIGGVNIDTRYISHEIIRAENIFGVEISENGKGMASSNPSANSLGLAAVGGLLFGGAGAVVGAVAGSNTKALISELSLKIAINDIKKPYVGINFLSETTGNGSEEYLEVLAIVQKWYGIVSILLKRNSEETRPLIKEKSLTYLEDGKRLIMAQKYFDAVDILSEAINANFKTSSAYYLRAIAYSKLLKKENALKDIKKAASLGNSKAIEYLKRKSE
ncbi:MAG: hypothetical protein RBR08_16125 [Desulforegulaceae bacterium]|nr:hypothetical protein [Desulforegulaceae bacterium]